MTFSSYPNYKDSGIEWLGEVPEHWQIKALRYLSVCLDGKRIPLNGEQRADKQGDIPYWGANAVMDYVDEAIFDEELLLGGEDGAPFLDPLKPVAFHSSGPVWPNNHIHVLRPNRPEWVRFLVYAMNSADYANYIEGSTRQKLNQSRLMGMPVSWPSYEEQTQIARFLDHETARIDALIEEQQRLIELLKEKRQAVISHAVTKGLDPTVPMKDSGVEWLGEVPAHWEVKHMKYLVKDGESVSYGIVQPGDHQAVDDACDGGRRQNDQRQHHPVHAGIFQAPCDEHAAEGRHGACGQVAAAGHDQEGHADGGQSDQRGGNHNVDEVSVCKVVGVQRRENRGHQNQRDQKHKRVAGDRQLEAFLFQSFPLCGIVCHIMSPPS